MRIKQLCAFLILLVGLSSVAYAQTDDVKIAYMDPQEVLERLPQTADLRTQMDTYIQTKQQEVITKDTEVRQEYATFLENAVNLTEAELQSEQERLDGLRTELEEVKVRVQQEVAAKRNELLNPILTKMDDAVRSIAEEMGIDFVLNKNTQVGDVIVFYGDAKLDITEKVIEIVKK